MNIPQYPRRRFEMTQAELDRILDACKAVPMIMLQCGSPSSPQENANRAWAELGQRMGFDYMTVEPVGRDPKIFTAIPTETAEQKIEREQTEAEINRLAEITNLEDTIATAQARLSQLRQ